jgi:hypothetical protein
MFGSVQRLPIQPRSLRSMRACSLVSNATCASLNQKPLGSYPSAERALPPGRRHGAARVFYPDVRAEQTVNNASILATGSISGAVRRVRCEPIESRP